MKKIRFRIAAMITVLSLTACRTAGNPSSASLENTSAVSGTETMDAGTSETEDGTGTNDETHGSNILVAYFYWADNAILTDDVDAVSSPSVIPPGNVQQLAGWVQAETGGDLFSIRAAEPYPSDWDECLDRANQERGDNARPELAESTASLEQYDTVFLGYPKMEQGFLSV